MKKLISLTALMLLTVFLTACGGGGGDESDKTPPAAGTLDASFGTMGMVVTDYIYEDSDQYYPANLEINAMAIQSDGEIVVAGYIDNHQKDHTEDFIVARYNSDGTLDTTFGTNGMAITDFDDKEDRATAIAIQPDGKIVVAGYLRDSSDKKDFILARYTATGALDSEFGTNGKVTTNVGSDRDYAYGIALQSDGKIVVVGQTEDSSNDKFAVVRYNSNGTLDDSFDGESSGNGIVTTSISGSNAYASSVAIDSSGNIIVAGYSYDSVKSVFALARYKSSDGSLDTGFGTAGIVTTAFGSNSATASALALQSDGKIIVAGTTNNSSPATFNYAFARYNTNGSLDTSFGANGKVETYININNDQQYTNIYAMKIQSNGKIVVSGSKDNHCAIARYNADGTVDTTFGSNGFVFYSSGNNSALYALALQSDGKIVASGYMTDTDSNTSNFLILRLWP